MLKRLELLETMSLKFTKTSDEFQAERNKIGAEDVAETNKENLKESESSSDDNLSRDLSAKFNELELKL